jgi:uracil phosphoribosyltransferase
MDGLPGLRVIQHPLIQHKITRMRDKKTPVVDFRQLLLEISRLMAFEITRDLPTEAVLTETPLMQAQGQEVSQGLVLVPVLRAGLGMVQGILDVVPDAQIGHIGLYRDPETTRPVRYFVQLPPFRGQKFLLLDPMLATGHSALASIEVLLDHEVPLENIQFVALVSSPEGAGVVQERFPNMVLYTASLDDGLNDHAYILPGLGDAGDRLFGTALSHAS